MMLKLNQFSRNEDGNISILFVFAVIPLILSVGLGIDYANANARESQLNGIADAAALSALTLPMVTNITPATVGPQNAQCASQGNTQIVAMCNRAVNFFNAQAAALTGIGSVTPTVTVTQNGINYVASVAYTTTSTNAFASILSQPTMTIGGTSQAKASAAPNIDYWMMIDTSPSMAIAATLDDINSLVVNTSAQSGCGFGCHEYSPGSESPALGNPVLNSTHPVTWTHLDGKTVTTLKSCVSGTVVDGKSVTTLNGAEDNFTLARCLGVTLRIDLVNYAVQDLLGSYAPAAATTNHATYQAALYTFDYTYHELVGPHTPGLVGPTSNLSALLQVAGNLNQLEIDHNGCLNSGCSAPIGNGDQDTYFDQALSQLNTDMPNPGNGSPTGKPKEVLFIVSDAVPDTAYSRSNAFYVVGTNTGHDGANDWCTKIKQRNILIAFLYLVYNPLPTNDFYKNHVKAIAEPAYPAISPVYQAASDCATTGLFTAVNTGGDVDGAMKALFDKAATTAFLSQ